MQPVVHLHLDVTPDFPGVVVRHSADGAITVTRIDGASDATAVQATPPTAEQVAVGRILDRFARRNQTVHDMHAAMVERGWTSTAPQPTKAAANESYVHLFMAGFDRDHNVTLYLNSRYLECAGVEPRKFAATLPGAEVRPNGTVYLHFAGRPDASVQSAIEQVAELEAWAKGA